MRKTIIYTPRAGSWRWCVLLLVTLLWSLPALSGPNPAAESMHPDVERSQPPNVIFDTDIWSDIDDMLALAMLHALHDRHEINLVAVTISTEDPWCATYVDLVNTFYHHPDVPIGLVRDGMTLKSFQKKFPRPGGWPVTRYTEVISQRSSRDGSLLYPRRLIHGADAPEAVSLLRRTLAAQPDGSVVVVEVGYHTNLAHLLDSKPDAASPLDGVDLVARKVRLLSVMAGNFKDSKLGDKVFPKGSLEFNLRIDVPAAQKVFSSWPTPIVDSGFEIGLAMPYPGRSIARDFTYVKSHPVADTYNVYCNEMKSHDPTIKKCPDDHDHATFDLTSVLYAARPDEDYFSLSPSGTITVLPDGGSRFRESEHGKHRHLILSDSQRARTLEAMRMLVSQPPVSH